jgi:hypothetical protein
MSTTDQLVREAVDQIFQKMDQNHDSYLDAHEVITLLNMGLRHLARTAVQVSQLPVEVSTTTKSAT